MCQTRSKQLETEDIWALYVGFSLFSSVSTFFYDIETCINQSLKKNEWLKIQIKGVGRGIAIRRRVHYAWKWFQIDMLLWYSYRVNFIPRVEQCAKLQ